MLTYVLFREELRVGCGGFGAIEWEMTMLLEFLERHSARQLFRSSHLKLFLEANLDITPLCVCLIVQLYFPHLKEELNFVISGLRASLLIGCAFSFSLMMAFIRYIRQIWLCSLYRISSVTLEINEGCLCLKPFTISLFLRFYHFPLLSCYF